MDFLCVFRVGKKGSSTILFGRTYYGGSAIGIESGSGYGEVEGMRSYQDLISRVYSQKSNFQPSILWDSFIIYFGAYNSAANKFAQHNIQNNKGNDYYKQPKTITPISLLKLLVKTYE